MSPRCFVTMNIKECNNNNKNKYQRLKYRCTLWLMYRNPMYISSTVLYSDMPIIECLLMRRTFDLNFIAMYSPTI